MRDRCDNPRNAGYHNYGERGIRYAKAWRKFERFYADMGACPPGMTLERKDNDGNYTKTNCVWASRVAQANNTRRNRILVCRGEKRTLAEWARLTGIQRETITTRIDQLGWPLEKALTTNGVRA